MQNLNTDLPLIISMGEPAGIGGQICLKLANNANFIDYVKNINPNLKLVILGNFAYLEQINNKFNFKVKLHKIQNLEQAENFTAAQLCVIDFPLTAQAQLGKLNSLNSAFVVELIRRGTLACLDKKARALITAPVHKGIINEAGINFTGHTEFLQNLCNVSEVVMMLATQNLRVALATTHLALNQVSQSITAEKLERIIKILHVNLKKFYGVENPYIGVCGLNPHAGELGYFGREEIDIINPCMQSLREQGIKVTDALPADTIFTPNVLADKDAILAMYHDQGLPTLKYSGWDSAVNITLGLPIVRTSPDHGTALELANTNTASEKSLVASVIEADKISWRLEVDTHN